MIGGPQHFPTLVYPFFFWMSFQVALRTLFLHHLLCALLVGFVFYNTANDANQMFNHLKFCVGYVLFHTYTNIMMPVLVCE